MVIDRVEDHAYKADLLIKTLHLYAKIPPARIILHYVSQTDPSVVAQFGQSVARCTRSNRFWMDGIVTNCSN